MALIEWREEYCTGIAGVDYEHQLLIRQLNAVIELLAADGDRRRVIDGLDDIYGSIAAHFALEEQTMQRHGYDLYAEHKADHDRLLDEIRELTDEYERGERLDETGFQQRLADWFQHHFKTHDARLHRMQAQAPAADSTLRTFIRHAKDRLFHR